MTPAAPLDLRRLSVATLNRLLGDMNTGVQADGYRILAQADCGDGIASTADRLDLEISYKQNDPGLPERVILKTLLLHPLLRLGMPAILSLSAAVRMFERLPVVGAWARQLLFILVGIFQKYCPQAPDAMYQVESRFYHDIRRQVDFEAPAVYGAEYDSHSRQFAVLMEDLTLRGARFPTALESQSLDTVRHTLDQMATLHARYWNHPDLEGALGWIPTRLSGGMEPVFNGIGFDLVRYQVEQYSFKESLIAPIGRSVADLWQANWTAQARLLNGPQTLLHGDTHVGNTYVLPDGRSGLLDFQLLVRGHWCIDVTYYLVTALSTPERQAHERDLLAGYLQALGDRGVVDVPTMDQAWAAHRVATIWGLVIGWLITPPVNYGQDVTAANIQRTAQAIMDLDPFPLLEAQ